MKNIQHLSVLPGWASLTWKVPWVDSTHKTEFFPYYLALQFTVAGSRGLEDSQWFLGVNIHIDGIEITSVVGCHIWLGWVENGDLMTIFSLLQIFIVLFWLFENFSSPVSRSWSTPVQTTNLYQQFFFVAVGLLFEKTFELINFGLSLWCQ